MVRATPTDGAGPLARAGLHQVISACRPKSRLQACPSRCHDLRRHERRNAHSCIRSNWGEAPVFTLRSCAALEACCGQPKHVLYSTKHPFAICFLDSLSYAHTDEMCVVLSSPIKYRACTLPDGQPHIAYNVRVITDPRENMSEEIIKKLDCSNEKTSTLTSGDLVCGDITELTDYIFGSTSVPGRCPECERLLLYAGQFFQNRRVMKLNFA